MFSFDNSKVESTNRNTEQVRLMRMIDKPDMPRVRSRDSSGPDEINTATSRA